MKLTPPLGGVDTTPRSRGRFYTRVTKWGQRMQSWPQKYEHRFKPYFFYIRTEFALAGKWTNGAIGLQAATARAVTKGTRYVPRDALMLAMYGKAYDFIDPFNRITGRAWDVAPNPQLVLDLVGDTVGSILMRTEVGWVLLTPGQPGEFLTTLGTQVGWAQPPTGQSGRGAYATAGLPIGGSINTDTSLNATKGQYFRANDSFTLQSLAFMWQVTAGMTVIPRVLKFAGASSTEPITEVHSLTEVTDTQPWINTWRIYNLGTPITINTGDHFAIVASRTDGTDTTSIPITNLTVTAVQATLPADQYGTCRIAKKNPAVGDTASIAVSSTIWGAGCYWSNVAVGSP